MTADPIAGADFLVGILANGPATGNYQGVLKHGALFAGVAPLTGSNAGLFNPLKPQAFVEPRVTFSSTVTEYASAPPAGHAYYHWASVGRLQAR